MVAVYASVIVDMVKYMLLVGGVEGPSRNILQPFLARNEALAVDDGHTKCQLDVEGIYNIGSQEHNFFASL